MWLRLKGKSCLLIAWPCFSVGYFCFIADAHAAETDLGAQFETWGREKEIHIDSKIFNNWN
ncbi:hypothetical protein M3J09_007670 [Ascochyta lentis]